MRRATTVIACALAAAVATMIGEPAGATSLSGHESRQFLYDQTQLPLAGFHSPRSLRAGDFDCDGIADLAVGDPSASISGISTAGRVAVGFGAELGGLRFAGQVVHQNSTGAAGVAQTGDGFGSSLAAADFDGDGCDDLAVGVPGEAVDGLNRAGVAQMLFGSIGGLDLTRDLQMPLAGTAPHGPSAAHNKGRGLTAIGRLTSASSLPMLAIGAPGHSLGLATSAGGMSVRRSESGSPGGLSALVTFIDRNDTSFGRVGDSIGTTLASGDFNGDGFGDLVSATRHIGGCPVPTGSLCAENKGNLLVAYGASSVSNLTFEEINQDSPNVVGTARNNNFWGERLAVGDFDGDGFDDVAVGAPVGDGPVRLAVGSVTLLFGGAQGLRAAASRSRLLFLENLSDENGAADDRFGEALAVGDFNRDGRDDLAIGVPGRNVNGVSDAGIVLVMPRAIIDGSTFAGALKLQRGLGGIPGAPSTDDGFGQSLASGDFNGDGVDDLAVHMAGARNAQGQTTGGVSLAFATAFTTSSFFSVTPAIGAPGQSYTVTVQARRTTAVLPPEVAIIRGSIQVRASDGSQCTAPLSEATGLGSCTMTAGAPGVLTLTAEYPGAIGFRPSAATPRAYTVAAPVEAIFQNGFESP